MGCTSQNKDVKTLLNRTDLLLMPYVTCACLSVRLNELFQSNKTRIANENFLVKKKSASVSPEH